LIQAQQKLQQAEDELGQLTVTKEKQESSLQGELALLHEQHAAALAKEVIVANTNNDAKLRFEADMAALHAAKHQLETQLESAFTQLDVEKQLVKTLKEEISVLETRTHGMSQDIASCHQEADALKAQILSMEAAKHQEAENAQTVLLAARKEHEAAVCALDAQLTSSKESIASLTIEKDRLTVLLSALEKQHSEMSSTLQRSLQMEVEKVKDLEQSIVVLEESNSEKIALLEQKDAHIMDLAGQLADKDERMAHLMEVHEQERQARRDTLPPVPIFNNTVQLQDVEIRRLNTTVERLTKEIKQYEQENLSFKPLLSKRDGEVTLLKDQLEMLQAETSRLQKDNDQLHLKIEDLDRQLRDKTVAFQHAPPHSTIGRFAEYNVLPTSERMQVTEAMHLLHDFMLRTNEKHHLPDYFKTEISRDLTTQDLPDLALALKRSLQEIIGKMDAEIDGFAKMLSAKDKELATLKATLVAIKHSRQNGDLGSSLVNQSVNHSGLMSPIHLSPSDSERKRLLHSVEKTPVKDESSFITPLKGQSGREPTINSASRLASDWSGSSVNRSGGRRSVTVTPSAKEAARYHAELIRERKKLVVLEEEHADLLGLIAQQEVELSVFREKLQKLLGQDLVIVEREARDNVEKQYGVYTNFRDLADA
jgi:DNA repair exonuclease SbcCD ATPase subunit